jgi:hypothetical protein
MASWDQGRGLSLDASIRVEGPTAPAWNGCCAIARGRPLERLEQMADDALIYRFDKRQPDRRTQLRHTPWS